MRCWSLYHPRVTRLTDPTDHHVAGTERQLKPNTSPHHLVVKAEKQQLGDTLMTYVGAWTIEPARPGQSTDQGGVPKRDKTTIRLGTTKTTPPGLKIAYGLHLNCVVTLPDTKAPQTPYASPMR